MSREDDLVDIFNQNEKAYYGFTKLTPGVSRDKESEYHENIRTEVECPDCHVSFVTEDNDYETLCPECFSVFEITPNIIREF